jgi:hypothetical protein
MEDASFRPTGSVLGEPPEEATSVLIPAASSQQTAAKAAKLLVEKNIGFSILTASEKKNVIRAFIELDRVVYGNAFDLVRVPKGAEVDFGDTSQVLSAAPQLTLYEVKSTNRENITEHFERYFFSLSTAELLVAQSLKAQFKFAFVNIRTSAFIELTLAEVFARARAIYPTWSIAF